MVARSAAKLKRFFREVLGIAKNEGLVSDEHFTVDGTIIEAWASHKSFQPKSNDDDDDSNPPGRRIRNLTMA